jgi:hypothetical protein
MRCELSEDGLGRRAAALKLAEPRLEYFAQKVVVGVGAVAAALRADAAPAGVHLLKSIHMQPLAKSGYTAVTKFCRTLLNVFRQM